MEIKEIQDLIKFVAKADVTEVEIEQNDFKITIKSSGKKKDGQVEQVIVQQPVAMPVAAPVAAAPAPLAAAPAPAAAAPAAPAAPAASDDSKYITIKSPMIGTFYRKPSPDKPAFAEVGASIKEGDVICIVEAMKLFNEIEAEVSGTIVKVLADDQSPIEYDQPLFLVDPS